eukprot:363940-Chlamydomonas_euryale.AAC.17
MAASVDGERVHVALPELRDLCTKALRVIGYSQDEAKVLLEVRRLLGLLAACACESLRDGGTGVPDGLAPRRCTREIMSIPNTPGGGERRRCRRAAGGPGRARGVARNGVAAAWTGRRTRGETCGRV